MENQSEYAVDVLPSPTPPADISRAEYPRAAALHILWGVGILGLLLVNIRVFGLTSAQVMELWRGPHGATYQLLRWTHTLFDNALPALVALLFGAGILPLLSRPRPATGYAIPEQYIRACLWLMAFGVVNSFILLSPADVLFRYGIVAVFLFPLQRLSARGFLMAAIVTGLFFSGKAYWNYTDQLEKYAKYEKVVALEKKNKKAKLTDEQKVDKSAWEGMVKGVVYDKAKDDKAIATTRSADYSAVWTYLVPGFQFEQAWNFYQRTIWSILSLMLLGMALFRWGFFSGRLSGGQYAALAVGGLVAGQVLAWLSLPDYEATQVDYTKPIRAGALPLAQLLQPAERAFTAVGWAALMLGLYGAGRVGLVGQALAAAGRLALTNFLLQAALCTFLFYGYGLSYFGSIRLPYLYVVVAEIWLLQLVGSVVWLRHFRTGPAEWLWKALTLNQKRPFRQPEPTPVAV